ncbi:MAG TPA: metallophosphoesterase [Blastocatellia bacterium]|jgi:hypothetical protein|nr:metallophosphoesterase [Blastocatellia bacterium]
MNKLTGDREVVLKVLRETIDQLGRSRPKTTRAGVKALNLKSTTSWPEQRDDIVARLQRAYDRAKDEKLVVQAKTALRGIPEDPWYAPRDQTIALIQSAMDEYLKKRDAKAKRLAKKPKPAGEVLLRSGSKSAAAKALIERFDTLDPGWAEVALEKLKLLFRKKAKFITHTRPTDFRLKLADRARIAVVGDWGGGNDAARLIAQQIKAHNPDHVIHLGDVYYAGTEEEVNDRFLTLWKFWNTPATPGRSLALNSNHEMYGGGHAYFKITLKEFKQPASYFSLGNAHWRFIGLDTGYVNNNLNKEQVDWLAAQLNDGAPKNVLLTHHQLFSAYEEPGEQIAGWVKPFLDAGKITGWLWGHEHLLVIYKTFMKTKARCVGNGCFPYDVPPVVPPRPGVPVEFVNRRRQANGRGMHSFALLTIDGPKMHIDYIDQDGVVSFKEDW